MALCSTMILSAVTSCLLLIAVMPGSLSYSISGRYWQRDWEKSMQVDPQNWFVEILDHGKPIVPRGCNGKPADVYFVLDTSEDVTDDQLQKQKDYISDLAHLFYMGQGTTKLGIVTYGSYPSLAVRLGSHDNVQNFLNDMKVTPRIGGRRNAAKVLDYLRRKAFARHVARPEVAHVTIFLTNGYSSDATSTAVAARLLKRTGAYVYVLGLGGKMDRKELSNMVSKPAHDFIFTIEDYNIVFSLVSLLKIQECSYQVLPPLAQLEAACNVKRPSDILFALDHLSMGSKNSKAILAFIQDLLEEFETTEKIRTGVILNRNPNFGGLKGRVQSIIDVERSLGKVAFPSLAESLKRTRKAFARSSKDTQKTAVVFLDGNVPLTNAVFVEAKRNKFKKIETYVVFIGNSYNWENLSLISNGSGSDHILVVPDYIALSTEKTRMEIISAICRGL